MMDECLDTTQTRIIASMVYNDYILNLHSNQGYYKFSVAMRVILCCIVLAGSGQPDVMCDTLGRLRTEVVGQQGKQAFLNCCGVELVHPELRKIDILDLVAEASSVLLQMCSDGGTLWLHSELIY